MFNEFWKSYPRKVAKAYARKAWNKIKPDRELLDKMLKTLEWQKDSEDWKRDGGQFIPHPSSWLNGERWEDEPYKEESFEEKVAKKLRVV